MARACLLASFDGATAPTWLIDEIAAGLGGVTLFTANVESDVQVAELVASLRNARRDVIIAIDEEGGDVTRLDARTGSSVPGAAVLGAVDDVVATAAAHRVIGRRLAALDIDLDLAPCADVNVAAANPVIGVRSFGANAERVGRHVAAAVEGLQSVGVASCVKHFPGHGATVEDSHQQLPVLAFTIDELRRRELVPFLAAIRAGVAAIMTAHIVVPAADDVPATRSPVVLGLLRHELGFDGVIISDALDMAGVHGFDVSAADVSPDDIGQAAVASLAAGCDLLCLGAGQGPDVPAAVAAAIVLAIADGRLDESRVADAGRRIATMRDDLGRRSPDDAADEVRVAAVAAAAAAWQGRIPGDLTGALVVDCRPEVSLANFDVWWGLGADAAALDHSAITFDADEWTDPSEVLARATARPLIVSVRATAPHPWQRRLVEALAIARPDVVVVDLGWPTGATSGSATLVTWGASRASTRAAAHRLVAGDIDST